MMSIASWDLSQWRAIAKLSGASEAGSPSGTRDPTSTTAFFSFSCFTDSIMAFSSTWAVSVMVKVPWGTKMLLTELASTASTRAFLLNLHSNSLNFSQLSSIIILVIIISVKEDTISLLWIYRSWILMLKRNVVTIHTLTILELETVSVDQIDFWSPTSLNSFPISNPHKRLHLSESVIARESFMATIWLATKFTPKRSFSSFM